MERKRVLLIAGGGTLGSYTGFELVKMGYRVTVIALEPLQSFFQNLRYICGAADDALLTELFSHERFDCIVDFIHYPDSEQYKARGKMLLEHTDQLIFLSSYRVYADEQHPITEDAPQLLNTVRDAAFLAGERYALPKSRNEIFLRATGRKNWTIIRPLISFSHYRFDLVNQQQYTILLRALEHKKTILPAICRDVIAGVGWAGNVGKMIARLCCNEKALGEAFTLGAGENNTWGQVAGYYTEFTGQEFEWVDTESYLKYGPRDLNSLFYDRALNRAIDNSKVLRATGLTQADLVSTRDALFYELTQLVDRPDLMARMRTPDAEERNKRMDQYFAQRSKDS